MIKCKLSMFSYRSTKDNIINYLILLISLFLVFDQKNDIRIFIVLIVSTIIQISLCCVLDCYGVSIIYCFIFGFLIKSYIDKHDYKKSYYLIGQTLFLLILSGLNSDATESIKEFISFIMLHILFVIVGSLFTFIPVIKL
jgi:hypothetical protein